MQGLSYEVVEVRQDAAFLGYAAVFAEFCGDPVGNIRVRATKAEAESDAERLNKPPDSRKKRGKLLDVHTFNTADGEVIVLKPTRPISLDEYNNIRRMVDEQAKHSKATVLVVPHDFEIYWPPRQASTPIP